MGCEPNTLQNPNIETSEKEKQKPNTRNGGVYSLLESYCKLSKAVIAYTNQPQKTLKHTQHTKEFQSDLWLVVCFKTKNDGF